MGYQVMVETLLYVGAVAGSVIALTSKAIGYAWQTVTRLVRESVR